MKLLSTNTDTVSIEMSRDEFHGLRDVLLPAIEQLENSIEKRRKMLPLLVNEDEDHVCEVLLDSDFEEFDTKEFQLALAS
jgi:hypothetical protein